MIEKIIDSQDASQVKISSRTHADLISAQQRYHNAIAKHEQSKISADEFEKEKFEFETAQQNLILTNIKNRSTTLKVGKSAPKIYDKTLSGQQITGPNDQSILIFFFNTTCKSCGRSIPFVNNGNDSLKKKDIKMIGVCSEKSVSITDYWVDGSLNIPIIVAKKGKIFSRYLIHYVPTIVWIDKKNKIRYLQSYGEDVNQVFQNVDKMTMDKK